MDGVDSQRGRGFNDHAANDRPRLTPNPSRRREKKPNNVPCQLGGKGRDPGLSPRVLEWPPWPAASSAQSTGDVTLPWCSSSSSCDGSCCRSASVEHWRGKASGYSFLCDMWGPLRSLAA